MKLGRKSTTITHDKNGNPLTDKDGNIVPSRTYTNYYVVTDNGNYIAIKPAFDNDYKSLYVLSIDLDKSPF